MLREHRRRTGDRILMSVAALLLQGGAGREGFGADALSEQHGSDLDVFGRKLAGIIMADYTQLALSAGPLDIAGQVGFTLS